MNIAAVLHDQALERPEAAAIIDVKDGTDRITTFADLELAAARGAALLRGSGLQSGDTVLVFQSMTAELYIAMMALFRLGLTAMFIDPSAGRAHIERCCAIRPPAALLAARKAHLLRLVSPALRRIPRHFAFGGGFIPGAVPWRRAERLPPHLPLIPCTTETPALITFTSGSTGLPKAAVRSHGFLLEQHRVLERAIHLTPGAIDLTTLPVFVLANLASGVTSLLPDADLRRPGAIRPQPVLAQIDRFRPTSVAASPAFVERLCDGCRGSRPIAGFRHVFTGGAPVFPDHLDRFAAHFPGAAIVAVYGSTEAEPIAHIDRDEVPAEDRTAMANGAGLLTGVPVPEIRAAVIAAPWGVPLPAMEEAEFRLRCLPAGVAGEIVVSGGHVLPGYLNGVGDEETKFRVGGTIWHRTGDAGYLDANGRLWLLGRAAAVVRDARGELHPFAVECAARKIPGVERAALLGRDGRRVLFVQPRRGERVDRIAARETLRWAKLDEVRLLRRIPLDKRHNAKVDYTRLRQADRE